MDSTRAFWWRCIRLAHRGSSAFANDWQWFLGVPLATVLFASVASWFKVAAVTTGNPILDGVVAGAAAFVITYGVRFIPRLVKAPARLYYREKRRADSLSARLTGKEVSAPVLSMDLTFEKGNFSTLVLGRVRNDGAPATISAKYTVDDFDHIFDGTYRMTDRHCAWKGEWSSDVRLRNGDYCDIRCAEILWLCSVMM
jgi:hypothetical protein